MVVGLGMNEIYLECLPRIIIDVVRPGLWQKIDYRMNEYLPQIICGLFVR